MKKIKKDKKRIELNSREFRINLEQLQNVLPKNFVEKKAIVLIKQD